MARLKIHSVAECTVNMATSHCKHAVEDDEVIATSSFAIANRAVTIGKFDCIVFENFAKIDMNSFSWFLPETANVETLEFFESLDDPDIV